MCPEPGVVLKQSTADDVVNTPAEFLPTLYRHTTHRSVTNVVSQHNDL